MNVQTNEQQSNRNIGTTSKFVKIVTPIVEEISKFQLTQKDRKFVEDVQTIFTNYHPSRDQEIKDKILELRKSIN
jgi:hypothetical protein